MFSGIRRRDEFVTLTMMTKWCALLILMFFFASANAHGGNCGCSLGSSLGAGPIITMPAYTMPEGTWSVSIGSKYTNYGRLSSQQINRINNRGQAADDATAGLRNYISLGYGVTDDLTLIASYPFISNWGIREVHDGELESLDGNHGLGDLNLFAQYRFLKLDSLQAALLAGIKFPTGASERKSQHGEYYESHFQTGTGSFNPSFGLALSKQYEHFNVDANFLYVVANTNDIGANIGDSAIYNIAVSYPLNHSHEEPYNHEHQEEGHEEHQGHFLEKIFPQHAFGQHLAWDLILEANIQAEDAPSQSDLSLDNHGGTTMYISPGLRMTVDNKWFYNFSVGFPVVEALTGDQGGTDLQLMFSMGTTL